MKKVAFYHKNCNDGTMSAAIFLKKYPDAIVIPVSHGTSKEEMDEHVKNIGKDTEVYTLDNAIQIEYLVSMFDSVTTIDHHISVQEQCEVLDSNNEHYTFIFNNEKSGATLTWEYCFPDKETPKLVLYVEDLDLFTRALVPDSMSACTYLYLYTNDPIKFLELLDEDLDSLVERGNLLSEAQEKKLEKVMEREPLFLQVGDNRVYAYNVTDIQYLFGNRISESIGESVLMYKIDGEQVKMSIRSTEGQSPTALDIAQKLGGGGHVHAAGAAMNTFEFFKRLSK